MAERSPKAPLLGDYFMARRKTKRTFLDDIDALIDWRPIRSFLNKKLARKADAVGNPAYPALAMFKILLLQRWYNLSDPATEQALYDRLSFIRFVGLSFEGDVPDETTICRFRNGLIKLNILDKLLDRLNEQLEAKGLLVREGTVVDASVVESARRPRKIIDILPEDRAEEAEQQPASPAKSDCSVKVSFSDDADAAWLKKGRRCHYGYKIHAATDARDGFFLGGHATSANRSDMREFETLLDEIHVVPGTYVYGDKGYASGANRDALLARGLKDATMDKATRHAPLTAYERLRNRLISSVRCGVERVFGTWKRGYGLARARYLGLKKVCAELYLVGMAFNLKKAVLLMRT
ncbi:IS5 family transposase [Megalodesulfovibrio paquesii]